MNRIILASNSEVRKNILLKNGIICDVEPSKVDEDVIKESLLKEGATPEIVSKNLAELKANKISRWRNNLKTQITRRSIRYLKKNEWQKSLFD